MVEAGVVAVGEGDHDLSLFLGDLKMPTDVRIKDPLDSKHYTADEQCPKIKFGQGVRVENLLSKSRVRVEN